MKIHVDFSVITKSGEAIGHVNGLLDCFVEPQMGDTISFMLSPEGITIPLGHVFGGLLKVNSRVIRLDGTEIPLSLELEDFLVDTREQAIELMKYFESSFKLYANYYQ